MRFRWAAAEAESHLPIIADLLSLPGTESQSVLELTASDLARLWAERGERGRAADLLAPICGWFTEGFDTVDLKEAKALLDELA